MQQLIGLINETPAGELLSAAYRAKLEGMIAHLIEHNLAGLIAVLYRIDVSEADLKETLKTNAGADASSLITDRIIQRQMSKEKARSQFSPHSDIPEGDKW